MFPRKKRLSREAFPKALEGRRIHSPHFSIVMPRTGEGYAVVVSKKTAPLSVDRHAVKRRVIAVLRKLHLPAGLVVFPKKGTENLSFSELQAELTSLLSRTVQ